MTATVSLHVVEVQKLLDICTPDQRRASALKYSESEGVSQVDEPFNIIQSYNSDHDTQ